MVYEASDGRVVVYKSPQINGPTPKLEQLQAMIFEKHAEYVRKT